MSGPVSTWMGDHLQTGNFGKPSQYVTCHPDQLSLAIPLTVDILNTSKSWEVNGHDILAP